MILDPGQIVRYLFMKKILLLGILLLVLNAELQAQSGKMEDVVYLKNEWVIRGTIIFRNETGVKIQTGEGNIYYFKTEEIIRVTREEGWNNFVYKKRGFSSFTELGPLIAGKPTADGVTTAAFSFQTINGYKFSQYAFLGLGIGADLYAIQTIIPVFASFRGDISKRGTVIPYYFGNLGYGINITQGSTASADFNGGLQYALGIGLKIPFNRNAGFLFSLGYNYQKTSYIQQGINKNAVYNRLAVRAGFFL
jgi:hypothetical protein